MHISEYGLDNRVGKRHPSDTNIGASKMSDYGMAKTTPKNHGSVPHILGTEG